MTRQTHDDPSSIVRFEGSGTARALTLTPLRAIPGLSHAFTLRGSDPHAVLDRDFGPSFPLRTLNQVHGAEVIRIAADAPPFDPRCPPEGDALVSDRAGLALGVWVADCLPILICDPRTRALAAVHAGWRGTASGVLPETIRALRESYGVRASDVRIAIGPAIGPCCFEVGRDVVDALTTSDPGAAAFVYRGASHRIDLREANRAQALTAGVSSEHIHVTPLCTMCRPDLFESYRRSGGGAARMAGMIAWRT